MVVVSKNAAQSDWVKSEVELARKYSVPTVVPVRLDETPPEDLHTCLVQRQALDGTEANESLDHVLLKVARDAAALAARRRRRLLLSYSAGILTLVAMLLLSPWIARKLSPPPKTRIVPPNVEGMRLGPAIETLEATGLDARAVLPEDFPLDTDYSRVFVQRQVPCPPSDISLGGTVDLELSRTVSIEAGTGLDLDQPSRAADDQRPRVEDLELSENAGFFGFGQHLALTIVGAARLKPVRLRDLSGRDITLLDAGGIESALGTEALPDGRLLIRLKSDTNSEMILLSRSRTSRAMAEAEAGTRAAAMLLDAQGAVLWQNATRIDAQDDFDLVMMDEKTVRFVWSKGSWADHNIETNSIKQVTMSRSRNLLGSDSHTAQSRSGRSVLRAKIPKGTRHARNRTPRLNTALRTAADSVRESRIDLDHDAEVVHLSVRDNGRYAILLVSRKGKERTGLLNQGVRYTDELFYYSIVLGSLNEPELFRDVVSVPVESPHPRSIVLRGDSDVTLLTVHNGDLGAYTTTLNRDPAGPLEHRVLASEFPIESLDLVQGHRDGRSTLLAGITDEVAEGSVLSVASLDSHNRLDRSLGDNGIVRHIVSLGAKPGHAASPSDGSTIIGFRPSLTGDLALIGLDRRLEVDPTFGSNPSLEDVLRNRTEQPRGTSAGSTMLGGGQLFLVSTSSSNRALLRAEQPQSLKLDLAVNLTYLIW